MFEIHKFWVSKIKCHRSAKYFYKQGLAWYIFIIITYNIRISKLEVCIKIYKANPKTYSVV